MGSAQTLPGLPASAQKPPGVTLRMLADAPPAPASFACVGHAADPDGEQHSGCIPYPRPRFLRGAVIPASKQHFRLSCLGKCCSGARSPPPFDFCCPSSSRRPRRAPRQQPGRARCSGGPALRGPWVPPAGSFVPWGLLGEAAAPLRGNSVAHPRPVASDCALRGCLESLVLCFLLTGSGTGRVRLDQGLGWGVPAGVWHVWRQRCCSVQAFPTPPAPRPPARPCWRP